MAKLPKSIIKKYGISKKAWSVFRGHKSKSKRRNTMGKRKSYRRSGGSSGLNLTSLLIAGVYGAARPTLKNAASSLTARMPFGNYNENVALGGAALVLPMFIKNKMVKQVAQVVQVYEAASAGSKIAGGVATSSSMDFSY